MKKLSRLILKSFLFFILIYGLSLVDCRCEVPHLINYQGRLTDSGGAALNGSYSITFRIYDASSGGTFLWQETQSVVIQEGVFNVLLGSVTNLNLTFDKPYFLEFKVGSEVMSPRQRIASAGYAINAGNGTPRGGIIMWSGKIVDIPSGWILCDGSNGTPDLRDKFIVGARQDDAGIAKTQLMGGFSKYGGEVNLSVSNLPSHTHTAGSLETSTAGEHNHMIQYSPQGQSCDDRWQSSCVLITSASSSLSFLAHSSFREYYNDYTNDNNNYYNPYIPRHVNWDTRVYSMLNAGSHTHTLSNSTGATGSGAPYAPPYYALAYIMKL
ncbi:MAG: hypothetical protein ABH858_04805 [Candidatus Omnitrophota bacterium]